MPSSVAPWALLEHRSRSRRCSGDRLAMRLALSFTAPQRTLRTSGLQLLHLSQHLFDIDFRFCLHLRYGQPTPLWWAPRTGLSSGSSTGSAG